MHSPDLPVAVAESGGAGREQERGIVAGPAVPARADPRALAQRQALGVGLPAPAAGQVQDLGGGAAHRQHCREFVEAVGAGAVVVEPVPELEQAAVVDPDLRAHGDPRVGVGLGDDRRAFLPAGTPPAGTLHTDNAQAGRERLAVPVAAEAGPPAPARGCLRDQSESDRDVEGRVRHGVDQQRKVRQGRAEVGAEVQHGWLARAEVDEQ